MFYSRSIGSQVYAGEISMAGEGVALLPIHQKPNLRDLGKIGVERTDDRKQRERLRLDAGRVSIHKRGTQIHHRNGTRHNLVWLQRQGHKEYFVHTLVLGNRMFGTGPRVVDD